MTSTCRLISERSDNSKYKPRGFEITRSYNKTSYRGLEQAPEPAYYRYSLIWLPASDENHVKCEIFTMYDSFYQLQYAVLCRWIHHSCNYSTGASELRPRIWNILNTMYSVDTYTHWLLVRIAEKTSGLVDRQSNSRRQKQVDGHVLDHEMSVPFMNRISIHTDFESFSIILKAYRQFDKKMISYRRRN